MRIRYYETLLRNSPLNIYFILLFLSVDFFQFLWSAVSLKQVEQVEQLIITWNDARVYELKMMTTSYICFNFCLESGYNWYHLRCAFDVSCFLHLCMLFITSYLHFKRWSMMIFLTYLKHFCAFLKWSSKLDYNVTKKNK